MNMGLQKSDNNDYYGQGNNYGDNNYNDVDTVFANNKELKDLFEAFQNRSGKVSLGEFVDYLNNPSVRKNCTILIDKCNTLLKSKNTIKELDPRQFMQLFDLDLAERENFRLVFNVVDQSRSDSIGIHELNSLNQNYELNLKKEDMQLMIENLKKSNLESVTSEELYTALYKLN